MPKTNPPAANTGHHLSIFPFWLAEFPQLTLPDAPEMPVCRVDKWGRAGKGCGRVAVWLSLSAVGQSLTDLLPRSLYRSVAPACERAPEGRNLYESVKSKETQQERAGVMARVMRGGLGSSAVATVHSPHWPRRAHNAVPCRAWLATGYALRRHSRKPVITHRTPGHASWGAPSRCSACRPTCRCS